MNALTAARWIGLIDARAESHSDDHTSTLVRMRRDSNKTTTELNPTMQPLLLFVIRSVAVGAAAKCALASLAVTAAAFSIPQAWSSWTNKQCALNGETRGTADGETHANSSHRTPQSQRLSRLPLLRLRCRLSHPRPQRQHRRPQRSLLHLPPAHADRLRRTKREPLDHGLPPLQPAQPRPVLCLTQRSSRMGSCPSKPSSANDTTKPIHFKLSQLQWQRLPATKSAKPQRQIFKRPRTRLTSPRQQRQVTSRPRRLCPSLSRHSAKAGQTQLRMRTSPRARACLYLASALCPARSL